MEEEVSISDCSVFIAQTSEYSIFVDWAQLDDGGNADRLRDVRMEEDVSVSLQHFLCRYTRTRLDTP